VCVFLCWTNIRKFSSIEILDRNIFGTLRTHEEAAKIKLIRNYYDYDVVIIREQRKANKRNN